MSIVFYNEMKVWKKKKNANKIQTKCDGMGEKACIQMCEVEVFDAWPSHALSNFWPS